MAKAISKVNSVSNTEKPPAKVDNKLREDWNAFLSELDKKGVRGNPMLDNGGIGYKLFDEYVKANPKTTLSRATLPAIRSEMVNYRNWVLNEAKAGRAQLPKGLKEEQFMKHVLANEGTGDPIYPGSMMTSTPFPSAYLQTFLNKELVKNENTGFSTINK